VGISPHYLSLFESGERQPDGAILRALGRVLGVSAWEQGS
jgi:transcriptional regulator with XRE-family HTH domain